MKKTFLVWLIVLVVALTSVVFATMKFKQEIITDQKVLNSDIPVVVKLKPLIQELSTDDIELIKKNIKAHIQPKSIVRRSEWHVPENVRSSQMLDGYALTDDIVFSFVVQQNQNTPLTKEDGYYDMDPVSFIGVIFTVDNGQTWKRVFTIPTSTVKYPHRLNPIGMFEQNGKYALDLSDSEGAGSGEGNMLRYWTEDGQTWIRDETCYYYVPEVYFEDGVGGRGENGFSSVVKPTKLKKETCPDYVFRFNDGKWR